MEQQYAATQDQLQQPVPSSSRRRTLISPRPLEATRYRHALDVLLPSFPALTNTVKGAVALKAADCLIRDDASEFLRDQIPSCDGPWHEWHLPKLSSSNSVTDRLVQISRRLETLSRRQPTDDLSLHFHSVLHFQLFVRYEQTAASIPRSKGTKTSSIALDRLLVRLYETNWSNMGSEEKQKHRDRFHSRKTSGKRLQILCDNLGYGILLLGSQTSIRDMQVLLFRHKA